MLGVPTVADGSPRRSCARIWSRRWSRCSTPTPMGIDRDGRRYDAVGVCRERCWRSDWVLDLDIRTFFDTVPWDLVLKAVAHHTDQRWILLYVERWLKAPLQREDGSLVERDRGTPQGSAISPLLANMFMHYAFDAWMAREFPAVRFERYCDDIIVHARSERQALQLRAAIARGWRSAGLSSTSTRPASCTARTRPARLLRAHVVRRSWGTRSVRGCRRTGSGSTS